MDKKIANNMMVGVFVLLGTIAFVYILFTVSNGKGLLNKQYVIKAKFHNVKGLHYGSEVSLSGLSIGVVKGISIAPDSNDLVTELAIEIKMHDRVKEDSVAAIRTQGILGDKYVEISIGDPSAQPLKEGAFIRTDEPKDLLAKSGELVEDVGRHFSKGSDFDSLILNLNRVALNLATFTSEMRSSRDGLLHEVLHGSSGQNVNKATANLNEILRKINSGEGSLGALINDPSVYEDLKAMMGGAKRSAVLKYFMRQFIESGEKNTVPNSTKASGK